MSKLRLKNVAKKTFSVALATVFAAGCIFATGCDGVYVNTKETESADKVIKPKTISVLASGIAYDDNGAEELEEYIEKLLADYGEPGSIDLDIVTPDEARYFEYYASSGPYWEPDVLLVSAQYYDLYASANMLWDMTEAWEKSKTKNSGRLIEGYEEIISSLYVSKDNGEKALYGFSPMRGNGCCTYVKAEWLEKAGIDKNSIKDKTLTFDEYYDMLKKMKATSQSDYVICPPGFIADEAPYTHFLPEFYQDAHFSFYKNEEGEYVDGFSEQAMIDAINRIKTAIGDGIISKAPVDNAKINAKDYFCSTDPKEETGVFTYWAGNWANKLKQIQKGALRPDGTVMSGELIALKPIAELGEYVERKPAVWCIRNSCENPEGVFEYFIDTMLDGGDIQMAWQYGVKGTHWQESVQETEINYLDPVLALGQVEDSLEESRIPATTMDNMKFFRSNSRQYEAPPMTEEYGTNMADINKKRKEIICKVLADPSFPAEQGVRDYQAAVGHLIKEVLDSMNNRK